METERKSFLDLSRAEQSDWVTRALEARIRRGEAEAAKRAARRARWHRWLRLGRA